MAEEHSGYHIYSDKPETFRTNRRPKSDSEVRVEERVRQEREERGRS